MGGYEGRVETPLSREELGMAIRVMQGANGQVFT